MNKKITAVTLTALMVLTLFTALVPSASAAVEVAAPYEFLGIAERVTNQTNETLSATSMQNPSILYYDIDDQDGNETLDVTIETDLKMKKDTGIVYKSTKWTDKNKTYISYLGNKHFVVKSGGSEWIVSEVLLEEDDTDDHLLRVGESLALAEGFIVSALEIDVDGKKVWLSVSQDGEELKDIVVTEIGTSSSDGVFLYEEDLGATDDTPVLRLIVRTVFAGMNTNLVKIDSLELISMDTSTIESGDDTIDDYDIDLGQSTITITNDKDVSAGEDDTTEIMGGMFSVKVGEMKLFNGNESWIAAITKTVVVGGGAVATEAPTEVGTEEPTVEPTNVTGVATVDGTAVVTAVATDEAPITEPTDVAGFEAVFAVAGLLAVAYLVLRQRE